MKSFPILWIVFAISIVVLRCSGCTNNDDFANPLDPENLRTAGSPVGLSASAGDAQVKVSWQNLGFEGIAKYRIYRQFPGDSSSTFERVGEVDAPGTEFIDKGLKNDQFDEVNGIPLAYVYRISYVDTNDVETPDPNAPPSENAAPQRIWPTARATPSVPPPVPQVTLGEPSDLTVKLFWQDYQPPDDFKVFRVFAAIPDVSGRPLQFKLLAERTLKEPFFFDLNFDRDGITKVYRVIAVDQFGAEGIAELRGTAPDLPPAPPKNVRALYQARSLFNNKYDVTLSWSPNKELDLDGYQIYSTKQGGGDPIPRNTVDRKKNSVTISGEDPILEGEDLVLRQYFITAFDNTPKPDGSRDESQMVAAPLPQ